MIADYSSLPQDLLAALDAVLARGDVIIASDFDGVLAPLIDNPSDSRTTDASAAALTKISLHLSDSVHLALVSGRMLDQLYELAKPPEGAHLIGSHGAERGLVQGGVLERQTHYLSDAEAKNLESVTLRAQDLARSAAGAWVEHKPAAAVLHTRLAANPDAQRINAELVAFCRGLSVYAMEGKDVVEVAVQKASKGVALLALKEKLGAENIIYLGDDVTDETVFETLSANDVGVKVGAGETAAKFRVQNVTSVSLLLSYIADKVIQDC